MPLCTLKVPFEDLPDSAEVTGEATRDGGRDARDEKNADTTVLTFRREKLGAVRKQLEGKTYDNITITDIRFSG